MALFVVLEGGEGSGKSTLAEAIARRAEDTGREVVLVREPGGTPVGERVRELLHEPLTPWAETFAFLLARAQLVATVIQPALYRGAVVLCDRFSGSTFAYQGYGRGLDLGALRSANRLATGGLEPDLTIYVDIEPALGLARKRGEAEALLTGQEDLAFHQRVREGYRAQLAANHGSWFEVDGRQSPNDVADAAWGAVSARL